MTSDVRTDVATDDAVALIDTLATQIGPRRPTGEAERRAAAMLVDSLRDGGVSAKIETFRGYATFAAPAGAVLGAAAAPALLPRRLRRSRALLAAGAAAAAVSEGGLRWTPLSDLLARRQSANVVASVEPRGPVRRTVCLVSHLDTSRSGVLFCPRVVSQLNRWIELQSLAVLVGAGEPLLRRSATGQRILTLARCVAVAGLALLIEREIRGQDVAGANDNASGCAVTTRLAIEVAREPLEATRLALLITGCEECGTLGARAFADSHPECRDWLFVNVDGVAAPATLRYLEEEGIVQRWAADPGLVGVVRRIAAERADLGVRAVERNAGLSYDATPLLARGMRAITLSAQDERIPNYHWPTDTAENVDRGTVRRSLELCRQILRALDSGEADG